MGGGTWRIKRAGAPCVTYSIKLTESVEDLCRCITHRGVRNRRPENISRGYFDDQDESYNPTAIQDTFHSMEYRVPWPFTEARATWSVAMGER